ERRRIRPGPPGPPRGGGPRTPPLVACRLLDRNSRYPDGTGGRGRSPWAQPPSPGGAAPVQEAGRGLPRHGDGPAPGRRAARRNLGHWTPVPSSVCTSTLEQPPRAFPLAASRSTQTGTVMFWTSALLSAEAVPVMAPRARAVAARRPEAAAMRFIAFPFGWIRTGVGCVEGWPRTAATARRCPHRCGCRWW